MRHIKLLREPSYEPRHKAFTFQKSAVEQIKELEYAAILHEQGLGKSKIAIDLTLTWLNNEIVDTVIIVTKKSLVENWKNELRTHCHVTPRVLTGQASHDGQVLLSPARIIICHYELINKFHNSISIFCETRDTGIMLDESQKIKNPNSKLAKSFFKIATGFKKRIIITGTPIANRPYDIWSQFYFLDQGNALGDDFKTFQKDLDLHNDAAESKAVQSDTIENLKSIYPKIRTAIVRETKDGGIIDLPQKNFHTILIDWESRQQEIYEEIKLDLKTYIAKDGDIIEDNSESILKRINRLQQTCSYPSLFDESYKQEPGKAKYVDILLEEISSRNEKFIIWTQFIGTADKLQKKYSNQYNATKITGKLSIDQRNKNIEKFTNDLECRCLIATYGAAKEGLTLTIANNAIFYDRSLSLDDYLQSQDRIHRISQTKECNMYILKMKNSIEQWVDSLLTAKENAAKLALNDITPCYFISTNPFDFGLELKKAIEVDNV